MALLLLFSKTDGVPKLRHPMIKFTLQRVGALTTRPRQLPAILRDGPVFLRMDNQYANV